MSTKRELERENEILHKIVDSDKRLVGQYETAKDLNRAQRVISLFIGFGIGIAIVFLLHCC